MNTQFYKSRPRGEVKGEYWGPKEDPDGRVRDMSSPEEVARRQADAADECAWVASCIGLVLDYGCGDGALCEELAKHAVPLGYEPDEKAARRAVAWGCEVIPSLDAFTRELGGILCHHVIEHCEDPMLELGRMYDLLRPGGRIVVSTPDFDSPVARRWGERYRMLHDPTHISLFSTWSLVQAMRHVGFSVVQVTWPFPEHLDTEETWRRLREDDPETTVSPPAPGNHVSVYAVRPPELSACGTTIAPLTQVGTTAADQGQGSWNNPAEAMPRLPGLSWSGEAER